MSAIASARVRSATMVARAFRGHPAHQKPILDRPRTTECIRLCLDSAAHAAFPGSMTGTISQLPKPSRSTLPQSEQNCVSENGILLGAQGRSCTSR